MSERSFEFNGLGKYNLSEPYIRRGCCSECGIVQSTEEIVTASRRSDGEVFYIAKNGCEYDEDGFYTANKHYFLWGSKRVTYEQEIKRPISQLDVANKHCELLESVNKHTTTELMRLEESLEDCQLKLQKAKYFLKQIDGLGTTISEKEYPDGILIDTNSNEQSQIAQQALAEINKMESEYNE